MAVHNGGNFSDAFENLSNLQSAAENLQNVQPQQQWTATSGTVSNWNDVDSLISGLASGTMLFAAPETEKLTDKQAEFRRKLLDTSKPPTKEEIEAKVLEVYDAYGVKAPKFIVIYDGPPKLKKGDTKHVWGMPWSTLQSTLANDQSSSVTSPLRALDDSFMNNRWPRWPAASRTVDDRAKTWLLSSLVRGELWADQKPSPKMQLIRKLIQDLSLMTSGFIFAQETAYIVRRPVVIAVENTTTRQVLSSEKDAAVIWPDGSRRYFLGGVEFTKTLWTRTTSGKMTVDEALNIKDVDQRSQVIKRFEPAKMISALNAKQVNAGVKRHYKWQDRAIERLLNPDKADITVQNVLYATRFFQGGVRYFLSYTDPSTGAPHISFVTQLVRTHGQDADALMAAKHHMTKKDYLEMVSEA